LLEFKSAINLWALGECLVEKSHMNLPKTAMLSTASLANLLSTCDVMSASLTCSRR